MAQGWRWTWWMRSQPQERGGGRSRSRHGGPRWTSMATTVDAKGGDGDAPMRMREGMGTAHARGLRDGRKPTACRRQARAEGRRTPSGIPSAPARAGMVLRNRRATRERLRVRHRQLQTRQGRSARADGPGRRQARSHRPRRDAGATRRARARRRRPGKAASRREKGGRTSHGSHPSEERRVLGRFPRVRRTRRAGQGRREHQERRRQRTITTRTSGGIGTPETYDEPRSAASGLARAHIWRTKALGLLAGPKRARAPGVPRCPVA
eukprot:scaffold350_cov333-Pavlova_lutheri.AAC.36